jgi:hypothetical protein
MAKVPFTAGRVASFKCPVGKPQAFKWDATTSGLGLRATPAGKPSYVFQSRYQDKTIRVTIGSPDDWTIPDAQGKVRELQRQIDEGRDPRQVKAERTAADVAKREAARQDAVSVSEVWTEYLEARRPMWGDRHYADHLAMAKAGGQLSNRGTKGKGVTVAGPIHPLLALRLADLTPAAIEAWATNQAKTRPTYGRLAWRCLKVFLTWCSEQDAYRHLLTSNPAKTKKSREAFGRPSTKSDVLQREQLVPWFSAVRNIGNPIIATYLQTLLMLGARPGEVLALRWEDINTTWNSIAIRDKVEGERMVPLTPYVSQLLAVLPRHKDAKGKSLPWIFSSPRAAGGVLSIPRNHHVAACKVAGLEGLTLHGLRRSFASLTEWLEIPAGVVAQIMGHKPSATAEKHYKVRPLELLAIHHKRIEAWILEQAGVPFVTGVETGKLRVVAG